MKRFYFISDDLDDLEAVEAQLEADGVITEQIHVLSLNDAEVEAHHLHQVQAFMKKDVVHSAEIGALIGLVVSAAALIVVYLAGWYQVIGWIPFVFLAIVLLGFCTWEGGLIGIHLPNSHFRRFQRALQDGRHVLFVDLHPSEEPKLKAVLRQHPKLEAAGTGTSSPRWIIHLQRRAREFAHWAP